MAPLPAGHFDPGVLAKLRRDLGLDEHEAAGMVRQYLAEAAGLEARLLAAAAQGDAPAARRAAHTLKSASAQFGAVHLAALCREVEALAQEDHLPEARLRLPEVRAALADAAAALRPLAGEEG